MNPVDDITLPATDGTAHITLANLCPERRGARFDLVVSSSGFTGRTGYALEAAEFRSLVEGLRSMYDTMHGSADLRLHLEEDHVKFEMNARGQVLVTGVLAHYREPHHRLEFGFYSDQSCLPPFIRALSEAGRIIVASG